MAEHWTADGGFISDAQGQPVAVLAPGAAREQAALIVRAVNAYQPLVEALRAVTEHMDRAGGDRDGMPECPWCRVQDDQEHMADCELLKARAVLAQIDQEGTRHEP